ncbi:MAG TPA: M28 family peptidase [Vicinamibacterales bacterium]|nr:M28 family peptidase [Vicinamibacterales bacterium]
MTTCRFYSVVAVAALVVLPACAVRSMPPATAAAAAPLFANAVADVARMERDTNEARFEALTAMLAERRIAFTIEPFTIEPNKREPRTQGRNIVVTIPGRTPEIVVGAHYDAARLADGTLSKGAVDNAASAMVLVRLADTLSNARPRNQVRIVFFDMEELGLFGSAEFVRIHRDRPVRLMVNLDVNAFGDTTIFGSRIGSNAAALHALRLVCATTASACVEFPRMPPSDDISFSGAAIPAVSIATMPQLHAHQLWMQFNGGRNAGLAAGFVAEILRSIHTPADTSALVTPQAMAQAYRVALGLIRAFE